MLVVTMMTISTHRNSLRKAYDQGSIVNDGVKSPEPCIRRQGEREEKEEKKKKNEERGSGSQSSEGEYTAIGQRGWIYRDKTARGVNIQRYD